MIFLKNWNREHSSLSKYLLSKFMQLVDTGEVIQNRFRLQTA